ncbi:hypothetical protein C8R45DRAFT_1021317 [Mycena sanguinolenta]|nr:hypothetical protein C8R45DRAFT_1021317 [Mycena sanguinolenta]
MAFFGMDINADEPFEGWKDMDVQRTLLPSTAINFTEHVYCAHDVRRYRGNPTEVPTPAFLFGRPFQSLVAHFGGILKTALQSLSNGDTVEDVVSGRSVLFFVRAFRQDTEFLTALAQVCGELFGIFHFNQLHNKDAPINKPIPLPVRTCLCDSNFIYFLSYDGKELSKYVLPRPTIANSVDEYVMAAINVSHYVLGILLEAYNHIVMNARSEYRARVVKSAYTLDSGWETAAKLGWESAQYFGRAHDKLSEIAAEKGLQKLYDSLTAWASANRLRILLPPEIKAMSEQFVKEYFAPKSFRHTLHEGVEVVPRAEDLGVVGHVVLVVRSQRRDFVSVV